MRMTDDELAAAAEEFLPAEPIEDDEDGDNDYEDDLSYESDF